VGVMNHLAYVDTVQLAYVSAVRPNGRDGQSGRSTV